MKESSLMGTSPRLPKKPKLTPPKPTQRIQLKAQKTRGVRGIHYDEKAKSYKVTFYYGIDKTGKQIRVTHSYKQKEAAIKAKKDFEAQKRLKIQTPPPSKITFNEYIKKYIESLFLVRSPTTIYGYERILGYIEQHNIAKKPIQNIKPQDIREYVQHLQENTKMKPQSINKHLVFLTAVLERAWKDEIIQSNPAKKVDKLTLNERKFTGDYYTLEECNTIFNALENYRNTNIKLVFYFGIYLGLRRGEMLGLKWENIDFENAYIKIVLSKTKAGGKVIMKAPKSLTSNRKVAINSTIIQLLKEVKSEQERKFGACEFVMINPQTGKPLTPTSLQKPFKLFLEKNHLRKLRIHDLRHTCGTLALQTGVLDIKSISNILGHTDTRITEQIYIHQTDTTNQKAANAISTLIENARK